MVEQKIREILFESMQWLLLQKPENISEDELMKLYSIKPGEVNIILARTAEFLKDDHPGKTKRDVIIEILEVLSRSYVARKLIGTGLKDNYKLFKGFAVRHGDEHDNMPDPKSEIQLKPKDTFISWTTDATKGRENGATWDSTKGDPIGGLLVEASVDSGKILFDVNAVTNFVKQNINTLTKYNQQAAPGMAISETNMEYFVKEAPYYSGDYEVITPTTVNTVQVTDRWTPDESGTVQWQMSDIEDKSDEENPEEDEPVEDQEAVKEAMALFESAGVDSYLFEEDECYSCTHELEEGFMDFVNKTRSWLQDKSGSMGGGVDVAGGLIRGDTLRYLDALISQYKTEIAIYNAAKKFASMIPDDGERKAQRIEAASRKIDKANELLTKANSLKQRISDNKKLALDFTSIGE
jgi:hypothetical protein